MNFGILGLGHIADKCLETINYLNECLYVLSFGVKYSFE